MKKKIVIVILVGIIIGLAVWYGNAAHVRTNDEGKTTETNKTLEEYDESDDEVSYQFLKKVDLRGSGAYLNSWILDSDNLVQDGLTAASEKDGITVELELFKQTGDKGAGDVLENEYRKQIGKIGKMKKVEDSKVLDVVQGDDYWLQEIDYTLRDKKALYPCAVFIKIDELTDGNFLKSVITVDNSKGNEGTAGILKEVLDAYGIQMEETESTNSLLK